MASDLSNADARQRQLEGRSFDKALGELLIERRLLDAAGLERAQRVRQASDDRLHVLLSKLGLVSERDVAMGMADPLDSYAIGAMQLFAGKPVQVRVGVPADIEAALERLFGSAGGEVVQPLGEVAELGAEDDIQRLRDLASEAPVIRIVNRLISRAVEARASDIHIEPFEQQLKVRYRIDGVLQEVDAPPAHLRPAVLSRIKIMARLNIAERRLPQDGRIRLAVRGKDIDLRVATIPTMHGEAVVLRVLDRGSVHLDFAELGFAGAPLE